MTGWNVITIVLGALITVLPQLTPAVPESYRAAATAIAAALVTLWHLYQPSPSAAILKVETQAKACGHLGKIEDGNQCK